MKVLVLGVLVFCGGVALGNDGVFYALGNTLVPKRETTIELRKEVLKLKRVGDDMDVLVDFTFFNPGPEKTETVGFVTPPAEGDVTDKEKEHPQLTKFSVVVNGESLRYSVTKLEKSGFKTGPKQGMGNDFIYHFPVTFKKGENRIIHHYIYRGGGGVEAEHDFSYRLTTGKSWANGAIGDFTLEIDLGRGAFYSIPASFHGDGRAAGWEARKGSKLAMERMGPFQNQMQMFAQRDGVLRLKAKNFKPDYDLELLQFRAHVEMQYWVDDPGDLPKWLQGVEPRLLLPGVATAEELRTQDGKTLSFLRNYYFARKGYVFKNPVVGRMFEDFDWYDPQPGKAVELSAEEKAYVALIKVAEKGK